MKEARLVSQEIITWTNKQVGNEDRSADAFLFAREFLNWYLACFSCTYVRTRRIFRVRYNLFLHHYFWAALNWLDNKLAQLELFRDAFGIWNTDRFDLTNKLISWPDSFGFSYDISDWIIFDADVVDWWIDGLIHWLIALFSWTDYRWLIESFGMNSINVHWLANHRIFEIGVKLESEMNGLINKWILLGRKRLIKYHWRPTRRWLRFRCRWTILPRRMEKHQRITCARCSVSTVTRDGCTKAANPGWAWVPSRGCYQSGFKFAYWPSSSSYPVSSPASIWVNSIPCSYHPAIISIK